MPPLEQMDRNQYAVVWMANSRADAYGKKTVAEPIELRVRWEWKRKEMTGPDGTTVATDATVIVDRHIPLESIMWEGTLEEWVELEAGTGSAEDVARGNFCVVRALDETPALKGRGRTNKTVYREAGVQKWMQELPEIA